MPFREYVNVIDYQYLLFSFLIYALLRSCSCILMYSDGCSFEPNSPIPRPNRSPLGTTWSDHDGHRLLLASGQALP